MGSLVGEKLGDVDGLMLGLELGLADGLALGLPLGVASGVTGCNVLPTQRQSAEWYPKLLALQEEGSPPVFMGAQSSPRPVENGVPA